MQVEYSRCPVVSRHVHIDATDQFSSVQEMWTDL